MPLPKLSTPFYELKIPSTGEKVRYRPFLVREEKVLLTALESESTEAILDAMCDVVRSCTEDKIDPTKYPMFDVQYIFLHLRLRSVGETVELSLPCTHEGCGGSIVYNLDLEKIKVNVPSEESRKFEVGSGVGVIFRYPSILDAKKYDTTDQNSSTLFSLMADCIETIYDETEVYQAKDHTHEELLTFLESISAKQLKKIMDMFENVPVLRHEISFTCPKCKKKVQYTLEGMEDFFEYASFMKP